MALFVYVATTQGLVQVQGITEEDPDIDSLVCLDGSMQQLPISRDYHQFVKKGSGLIHKDFNHGSFRLDVDKPIDSGKSWQLGFYLAHYCKEQLASGQPQADDVVIWATGEVKIDKSLSTVAGVEQKCQQSAVQLTDWLQTGVKLLCVLPSANQSDIEPVAGVEFLACDHLTEVIVKLDALLEPQATEPQPELTGKAYYWSDRWRPYKWPASLVGLSILLGVIIYSSGYWSVSGGSEGEAVYLKPIDKSRDVVQSSSSENTEQVNKSEPFLKAFAKVAGSCQSTEVMQLTAVNYRFTSIRLDNLCQLELILPRGNMQVMGIALDTGSAIPVDGVGDTGVRWDIAIPSSKYRNRDYLLLLFDKSFYGSGRNPLIAQMRLWRWDDKSLSARLIQDWVAENNWPVVVYHHQLQDD